MKVRGLAARMATGAILAVALIAQAVGQSAPFEPVTDAMIQNPDPKDWLSWRRTLDSWGYSPLDEIDRGNVDELRLVWARPLPDGHQEGTPLVHNGVRESTMAWNTASGIVQTLVPDANKGARLQP